MADLPKRPNVNDIREQPVAKQEPVSPPAKAEASPPIKPTPSPPIKTDPWKPPIARPVSALPVPSRPPVITAESSSEEESIDGNEVRTLHRVLSLFIAIGI